MTDLDYDKMNVRKPCGAEQVRQLHNKGPGCHVYTPPTALACEQKEVMTQRNSYSGLNPSPSQHCFHLMLSTPARSLSMSQEPAELDSMMRHSPRCCCCYLLL